MAVSPLIETELTKLLVGLAGASLVCAPVPLLTVYWNVVLPVKPGSGVKVKVPLWLSASVACAGCVGLPAVNGPPPESPASSWPCVSVNAVY
jgi:hypothetical protein